MNYNETQEKRFKKHSIFLKKSADLGFFADFKGVFVSYEG